MNMSGSLLPLCFAATGLLMWPGCDGRDISNPSGACGTRPNEGRAGYQAGSTDTWVPDCQNRYSYTGQGAMDLVVRLNVLYGVP